MVLNEALDNMAANETSSSCHENGLWDVVLVCCVAVRLCPNHVAECNAAQSLNKARPPLKPDGEAWRLMLPAQTESLTCVTAAGLGLLTAQQLFRAEKHLADKAGLCYRKV